MSADPFVWTLISNHSFEICFCTKLFYFQISKAINHPQSKKIGISKQNQNTNPGLNSIRLPKWILYDYIEFVHEKNCWWIVKLNRYPIFYTRYPIHNFRLKIKHDNELKSNELKKYTIEWKRGTEVAFDLKWLPYSCTLYTVYNVQTVHEHMNEFSAFIWFICLLLIANVATLLQKKQDSRMRQKTFPCSLFLFQFMKNKKWKFLTKKMFVFCRFWKKIITGLKK